MDFTEEIHEQFDTVGWCWYMLMTIMDKIYRKVPCHVEMFKLEAQDIKLKHFRAICCYVISFLDENDTDSIKKVKLCIVKPGLETNLAYTKVILKFLLKPLLDYK